MHHLRALDSRMIRQMYEDLVYTKRNSKQVISNRLGRLVSRGVLIREEARIITDDPYGRKFYRLSSLGYQSLVEAGLLEQTSLSSAVKASSRYINRDNESKNSGQISVHTLTVTRLAFMIVAEWYKLHRLNPLNYFRGTTGAHLLNFNFAEYAVIPDYIFINENRILFLENDTGNQGINVLNQKLERYKRLIDDINKGLPGNELKFHILFSVVDKSLNKFQTTNAASRVGTVKSSNFPVRSWPPNMRVFVETSEKALRLSLNILNGTDISDEADKEKVITNMVKLLAFHLDKEVTDYVVDEIDAATFFKATNNGWTELPRVIRIRANGEQKLLYVTFIEPGDLRDYQKANRVDRMIYARSRDSRTYNIVTEEYNVYLYRYRDQMINDDIRIESSNETRMMSFEDLKNNWNGNFDFEWYAIKSKRNKSIEKGFFI